jgi:drug/metabolite transporter (DMT)-like permease
LLENERVSQPGPVEPSVPTPRQDRVPLGILYMIGATIMFSGGSALSKWLVDTYPVGELLFTRSIISLITCALIILPSAGFAVFRTKRPRDHLARGVSQALSQSFIIIAFSMMPLASAVAINFSAPLFATIAAILLFHERVGRARWAALVAGFVGVVVMTNPGTGTFQLGALFALGNAVLYGTVTAAVRGMSATESAGTLTMYQMVILTAVFALALPFGFVMPDGKDALLLLLNGVSNGVGQYWWTRSLHLAPASAVGPFYYFSLVWAIILGFLVWGDVPTVTLIAGSTVVVSSGLFLLWHESRR